jgi:3-hydroxyisobutyrate dehydrogenase-like beta-hydroxyacid dehydrogenase
VEIGFIGLGNMGVGMAANLLRAGHSLTVYNRTPGKDEALVRDGARRGSEVADACRGEVVFTMLSDDRALESVVYGAQGILAELRSGAIHISSSTISVELSKRLATDHLAAGQRFIAAPVFGRPDVAAAGGLSVVAAGAPDAIKTATPLLESVGRKVFVVSEAPRIANLVKLSGNFLIAAVIEALGEATALIGKAGLDTDQYLNILTSTLFDAPVYKVYGALIAHRKFEPAGFAASLGHKDIRLALAAAEELCVPLPLASVLRDRFLRLLANGGEKLDWSAIGGLAAKDAGLT